MENTDKNDKRIPREHETSLQPLATRGYSQMKRNGARKRFHQIDEYLDFLSDVFESSPEAFAACSHDGQLLAFNRAYSEMLGYSDEELKALKWDLHLTSPQSRKAVVKALEEMRLTGVPQHFEKEYIRKDGTVFPVDVFAYPILDQEKHLSSYWSTFIDLSHTKQAEELYSTLADASPVGVYIAQDRKFVFTNPAFQHATGLSAEELLGTDPLSIVYSEDRERVRQHAVQMLKGKRTDPYEFRVVVKGGGLNWALETVTYVVYQGRKATLGNFMEITERKQAQEELHLVNEKLTALVKRLEERNLQNSVLSEMRDLLQASSGMDAVPDVVRGAMQKLFPDAGGALFLMSPSRSDLEAVSRWGDFPEDVDDNVFTPDACWALRRGRVYLVEDLRVGPICPHLKHPPATAYMCLPLTAKGDVIGMLHVRSSPSATVPDQQRTTSTFKEIAVTLTEYLSLSIANIRLGESLASRSIRDPLTGLFNRRFLEETIQREITRAARKRTQIGVVMIDLDHFKEFNDAYGHAGGDELLMQLAKLLKDRTRGSDVACRYGGEEFVILLPDSSLDDSVRRANQLREQIRDMRVTLHGQLLRSITASMGVASYPAHGADSDGLLRIADAALYKAKQEGRDRVVVG